MNRARKGIAVLLVIVALLCVIAWGMWYEPALAVVKMPFEDKDIPLGALPMAAILFVFAFFVYPSEA